MIVLVVGASYHIRHLNSVHSQQRIALGKGALLVDRSLETAEEVERIESMERAMEEHRERMRNDQDARGSEVDGLDRPENDHKQDGKAFGDVTDLENEDFLYVF